MRAHFVLLLAALAAACSSTTATTTETDGITPQKDANGADAAAPLRDGSVPDPIDAAADVAQPVEKDAAADVTPDVTPAAKTFTDVYAIVSAKCAGCHQPSEGPRGALDLSTKAVAHAALVGVDAAGARCGSSGTKRVVAGSAQTSLLFLKVSPQPPCGGRMPAGPGAQPLSQSEIDTIASWINGGAPNN